MPATLNQLQQLISRSRRSRTTLSKQLLGTLFERATPGLLEHFTPDGLEALGRGAAAFLAQPAEVKVRVYNPSLETHGWTVPYTVVELSLPDRPFIVDSVRAAVQQQGLEPLHVLHPVLKVLQDAAGELVGLASAADTEIKTVMNTGTQPSGTQSDSQAQDRQTPKSSKVAYELFFVSPVARQADRDALEQRIRNALTDVMLATRDYGAMKAKAEAWALELGDLARAASGERESELSEYAAFMRWLGADHFVFLGYREYDILQNETPTLQVTPGSGLGILSKPSSAYETPTPLSAIPEELRERILSGRVLTVTKTNAEATVHRPVRMDYLGIKKVQGELYAGEGRFVGLFTSKALAASVEEIPILRRKLRLVLELDGAEPGSHDFKQLVSVFGSLPRDELFWSDAPRLLGDVRTVIGASQSGGVRVTVRPDPLARGLAVMVIMPRERFNSGVRRRVQAYLAQELGATHTDYQLVMGEGDEGVRFHFFFSTETDYRTLNVGALEAGVQALTRTWGDRLGELLRRDLGELEGQRLAARYADAFDERYRADTTPETALRDVAYIERLRREAQASPGTPPFVVNLLNPHESAHASQESLGQDLTGLGRGASHLEVYHAGPTLVLSDALPLLENLGLRVLEQVAYTFNLSDLPETEPASATYGLDIFRVQDRGGEPLEVDQAGDHQDGDHRNSEHLRAALTALLRGDAENDRMNRLVLSAGLSVRQVALLRAVQMYTAQLSTGVSRSFVVDTLLNQPALAAQLVAMFELKFTPELGDREEKLTAAQQTFEEGLQAVSSLAEDETLRALRGLVDAAVRTNYFSGESYISFKLASAKVPQMPEPRPLFEIAVSAPHVEGTHLRGGRVARGGLRWSDRPDDFRTEVLGLMKTQMTKNAVIVPVGSKGGFVLKGAPSERDALQTFVRAQYQTYLRGLLDLTDNLVDGQPVAPEGLVVYDDPDPYLVVAADKGTATFSDLANDTAAEYDFWLGDAFASGGSHGYDHKAEGITACGAWESVKRHFVELGTDVTREPITVFGIGDMSGDVFGNGLLYTDTLKLQAAFNHQHIFLDPAPDPAISFAERQRLFELPRSSWEDYDPSLLSEGGGVYSRFAKRIPLTPQVQEMLDITDAALSGQDLIQAILKMPADLFWNGGVGTYVKASGETHAQVGDSSNNAVRIDASDLRARVVGEGGNLGFTQLARVEYALAGGRINTDAVDNSAGVDMSDHEVNLKIALRPLVADGTLTFTARNDLLREMTAAVSELVLRDNAGQALTLSLAERRAERDPKLFVSLQTYLTERGGLRPEVEFLPSAKTVQGRPYTRPELAVLMAYTKMGLYRRLLETDLPDEPHFQSYLLDYFPKVLQARFPEAVQAHPLKREIIATQFTNAVVDRLGVSFVHRVLQETASSPVQTVQAGLLALELLHAPQLLERITGSGAATEMQYAEIDTATRAAEAVTLWLVLGGVRVEPVPAFVQAYAPPLKRLRRELGEVLSGYELANFKAKKRELAGIFGTQLAEELATLPYVPSMMGVVRVARESGTALERAAEHFYGLGERLSLGSLRDGLLGTATADKWEKTALSTLVMELRRLQVELSLGYLASGAEDAEAFLSQRPQNLKRYDTTLAEVQRSSAVGLASGGVLRGLLQGLLE